MIGSPSQSSPNCSYLLMSAHLLFTLQVRSRVNSSLLVFKYVPPAWNQHVSPHPPILCNVFYVHIQGLTLQWDCRGLDPVQMGSIKDLWAKKWKKGSSRFVSFQIPQRLLREEDMCNSTQRSKLSATMICWWEWVWLVSCYLDCRITVQLGPNAVHLTKMKLNSWINVTRC